MDEASKPLRVQIRTIQKWDRDGKIRCVRTIGGKRRVPESEIKRILRIHEERKIIGYARISSYTQKDDLESQVELIKSYAKERLGSRDFEGCGFRIKEGQRNFQKLLKMIMNKEVSKVIVAYPDRLTRFGLKHWKSF